MEQRTEEWFNARLGKVTASRLNDILSTIKTGESSYKRNYRIQLVTERLTGKPTQIFVNSAMQHGIDTEDEAKSAYIFDYNAVEDIGFVDHPSIDMSGASPDGLVGDEGMIEIKCPQPTTHTETLLSQKIPKKYEAQMLWQLACMPNRKWVDFVSYCPSFPQGLNIFVKRFDRDNDRIALIEKQVQEFLTEVEDMVNFIKEGK